MVGSFAKETYSPGADLDIMVVLSKENCRIMGKTEKDGAELIYNGVKLQASNILIRFLSVVNRLFAVDKLKNENWTFESYAPPRNTPPTISTTITVTKKPDNKMIDISFDIIPTFILNNNIIFIPFGDTNNFLQTNSYFEHDFIRNDIPDHLRSHFVMVVRILKMIKYKYLGQYNSLRSCGFEYCVWKYIKSSSYPSTLSGLLRESIKTLIFLTEKNQVQHILDGDNFFLLPHECETLAKFWKKVLDALAKNNGSRALVQYLCSQEETDGEWSSISSDLRSFLVCLVYYIF